jgi:tetratricopeptide (TPR) repeat protein
MGAPSQVDTLPNNQSPQFENNNNNDGHPPVSKAELEATYTSLIQQYLQVMCLDNATFLAERMVASCKTTNALYLLAVCHYRKHAPQRALCVLEDVNEPDAASLYLLAKCCFDLEHYGRAEEALFQQARVDYKSYKALSPTMSVPTMDEWIMETSPCPIPNGAAGFFLLGNICRKSNRKQRALVYYKMSLQVRKQRRLTLSFA